MRTRLPSKQTTRARIRDLLCGQVTRTADLATRIAAMVTADALTTIDATTFGLFNDRAGTDVGSITAGLKSYTSPDNPWTAADVGKTIDVAGAGAAGGTLRTVIAAYVSAGAITLRDAAVTTVAATVTSAGGLAVWGYPPALALQSSTLRNSAGASLHSLSPVVGGGAGRQLGTMLGDVVHVKDYLATGDGVTDDTVAIQAAVDSGAAVVTGTGGTYVVTTIILPSNVTLRDINLLCKATAAEVYLRPVVKIGGSGTVQNVVCDNVTVNGNRANLENISLAHGEDGGMHGFRIGSGAQDIALINCQATYCGSAGLAIHNEAAGAVATYPIQRVRIVNFVGTYNREHGMFADSFDTVTVSGAILSFNGLTIDAGHADTHGATGAKAAGALFGAGFDLETYVGFPTSYFKNFYADGIVCEGNAQASLLYVPNPLDEAAAVPAQNIHLKNVRLDKSTATPANLYALRLFANTAIGTKYGIDGMVVSGVLNGHIDANNVKRLSCTDGWIEADATVAYKALLNNGSACVVTCPGNKDSVKVETFGALVIVTDTGAGTFGGALAALVEAHGDQRLAVDGNITGGTIAGGDMSFTVTLPAGVSVISATVNAYNATSGKSAVANVSIVDASTVRLFVTPTDDTVTVAIRVRARI